MKEISKVARKMIEEANRKTPPRTEIKREKETMNQGVNKVLAQKVRLLVNNIPILRTALNLNPHKDQMKMTVIEVKRQLDPIMWEEGLEMRYQTLLKV